MMHVLRKSPINYWSDLLVAVMVPIWILTLIVTAAFAVFATIRYADTSMWGYVAELGTIPLTIGGGIWMIKNAVQHAIANNKGQQCQMDFPPVPGTEIEYEEDNGAG